MTPINCEVCKESFYETGPLWHHETCGTFFHMNCVKNKGFQREMACPKCGDTFASPLKNFSLKILPDRAVQVASPIEYTGTPYEIQEPPAPEARIPEDPIDEEPDLLDLLANTTIMDVMKIMAFVGMVILLASIANESFRR